MDVSQVITNTLALNTTAGDPFAGHLDTTTGVGVAGHSLGGMTTHGLLTAWPDSRIAAAVPFACVDMGNPSSTVAAKVLFIHGDQDTLTQYSSARQAYGELPAPKAFLTHRGTGHDQYIWSGYNHTQTVATYVDWMRWSLYADTAARDRLPADATSNTSTTTWEAVLTPSPPGGSSACAPGPPTSTSARRTPEPTRSSPTAPPSATGNDSTCSTSAEAPSHCAPASTADTSAPRTPVPTRSSPTAPPSAPGRPSSA